jgi:hypothetical protein
MKMEKAALLLGRPFALMQTGCGMKEPFKESFLAKKWGLAD